MHEGKNMGIMVTFKKPTPERGERGRGSASLTVAGIIPSLSRTTTVPCKTARPAPSRDPRAQVALTSITVQPAGTVDGIKP